MAWAYASNVYTQTGTDANPSELADASDATSRFNGLQEVISIPAGRNIEIEGTLTVNPERFLIRVEDNTGVTINNGGTLNLGVEVTVNSVDRITDGTGLVVGRAPVSWWGGASGGDCSLLATSGGSLYILGATLFLPSIASQAGSSLLIQDGRIITQDLNTGQTDPQTDANAATGSGFYTGSSNVLAAGRGFISWILATDVYIDGLTIEGGGELIIGAVPTGTNGIDSTLTNSISGIVARGMRVALFPNRVDDIEFSNTSLGGNGNFVDVPIQSHNDRESDQREGLTYTTIKNERRPGNCSVVTIEAGVDARNHGVVSFVREVELSGNSPTGVVPDGRYWMQDSEHERGLPYFTATGAANTIAVATSGLCTIAGTGPTINDMRVGHYLTVGGNDYRVTNISGSTITVEAPAATIPATENYAFSGTRAGAAIYKPSSGSIVKTYDKSFVIPGSATRVTDDRERKIYSGVLNASGKTGSIDVLTASIKVGAERGDPLTDNDRDELTWNLRGKDNDLASSKYDFHFWHPSYQYWTIEVDAWNDSTGILEVPMELTPDVNYVSASATITSCATSADIYAAIKQLKVSSADEIVLPSISTLYATYSHVITEIDFGTYNVSLDPSATEVIAVSGSTITVKTDTLFTGSLRTTGTITIDSGVTVVGGIADANGVRSTITITANDGDTVAYYLADGTEIHRSTLSGTTTAQFNLTPTQGGTNQRVVVARPGSESQVRNVSTMGGGEFSNDFSALRVKRGPDGDALYDATAVDARVDVAFTLTNLNSVSARINIGNYSSRARTCFAEFEAAKITANGMKYIAFGGSEPNILIDPVTGDSLYLPTEVQLRRRASTDSNAGILATVYHPDGTPVDSSNGDIQVSGGIVLDDFAQAFLVDTDIDFERAGLQSVATTLTNIRHEIVAYGVGAELTAIVFISENQAQTDFFNAINPGETVMLDGGSDRETIFSKVAGVPRIIYLIGDHHTIGASLTLDVGDESTTFSSANKQALETQISAAGHWAVRTTTIPGFMLDIRDRIDTNKTAIDANKTAIDATKTAVDAIPTSNPSVSDIVSGVQAADFEDGSGTNTLSQELASIKTAIGNIPTSNPSTSEIVTAIQGADFEQGSGTNTLAQVLASIATAIGNIPTSNPSASDIASAVNGATIGTEVTAVKDAVEHATHGLSAIQVLVDAIPTDNSISQVTFDSLINGVSDSIKASYKADISSLPTTAAPTTAQIVTAIQAADFEQGSDTGTLAEVLQSIMTAIAGVSGGSTFTQNMFDNLMDGVSASIKATYRADISSIPTTAPPTAAEIVTAIQGADFDSSGTGTLTAVLGGIRTAIDNIPTADLTSALGNMLFGTRYMGVWEAGDYAANDCVVHSNVFYRSKFARTSSYTNPPTSDSNWEAIETYTAIGALVNSTHGLSALKTLIDAIPTDSSIDQAKFDSLMSGVGQSVKDSYKASGTIDSLGHIIYGSSYQGVWARGSYAVGNYAVHEDVFYRCKHARTASHGNNPSLDSVGWEVAELHSSLVTLTDSTYGLSALKTALDAIPTSSESLTQSTFDSLVAGLPAGTKNSLKADVTILGNATHGLAALKTLIDNIPTDNAIGQSTFDTLMSGVGSSIKDTYKANVSALTNATHGLSALKTLIDAIPTDNSISQADFNTLMEDLTGSIKETFKADVSGISGGGGSSLTAAEVVSAIQAADFEQGSGTDTLAQVLESIKSVLDDNKNLLEHSTEGLAAIKAKADTIEGYTDILDDGTNGLAALKTLLDAIPTDSKSDMANAVRDLDIVTGVSLLKSLQIMLAIMIGRVDPQGNNLDLYTPVDNDRVVTVPQFSENTRPSGSTIR